MSQFSFAYAIVAIFGLTLPIQEVNSQVTAVPLNSAGNYVILTGAGITTTGVTHITGNLGISPQTSTAITGFALVLHSTYSTSSLVTGNVYASNYAVPTPATLITAQNDSTNAYNNAAGRTATVINLNGGNLSGVTLASAVYSWSTPLNIIGTVTLNGTASSVWIFQIAQTFSIASGQQVILTGGAVAANVFWQAAGAVALNSNTVLKGTVLAKTGITLQSGATLSGRFLAQTAVTLIGNTLVAA